MSKKIQVSISVRIAVLFSATFVVGLAAAYLITYLQIERSLERSNREVMTAKLRETSTVLAAEGVRGLKRFFAEDNNRVVNARFMVRVLNEAGETLYLKPSVQDKNFDFDGFYKNIQKPDGVLGWHALAAINDEDNFDLLTEKVAGALYLQIGKSSEDREDILEQIVSVFLMTGGLIFLLSIALGLWYARKSLAPLRRLLQTMGDIENGDLSQRVPLGPKKDELRDLGETFNRVISRIEKLIRLMRESLDNVAHEIRTPLTRVRAVAEDALILGRPERIREALEDCAESTVDISDLVDQLMSISEAEAGTFVLRRQSYSVRELLQDVIEIYDFVAEEKNIILQLQDTTDNLYWSLDRRRVQQALANLVDNAIKFSDPGTQIIVSARAENKMLLVHVQDQGPGVGTSDLPRIWDRLYRGDKSRTTKGLGLGLAIVRAIVIAHGGSVQALPGESGGMIFTITLPPA